jgi:hypothetical protein
MKRGAPSLLFMVLRLLMREFEETEMKSIAEVPNALYSIEHIVI